MPLIKISSNLPKENFSDAFQIRIVDVIATTLRKPKQYVACHIIPDQMMSFGGSSEPCAQVVLQSIGRLGVEENKTYSRVIADELQKLGIGPDRQYIFFHDVKILFFIVVFIEYFLMFF